MKQIPEKRLWFELDKIVTKESLNQLKTAACVVAMSVLEKPTPEECKTMFLKDSWY